MCASGPVIGGEEQIIIARDWPFVLFINGCLLGGLYASILHPAFSIGPHYLMELSCFVTDGTAMSGFTLISTINMSKSSWESGAHIMYSSLNYHVRPNLAQLSWLNVTLIS